MLSYISLKVYTNFGTLPELGLNNQTLVFLNLYCLVALLLQELFVCLILFLWHIDNKVLCRSLKRIFANGLAL